LLVLDINVKGAFGINRMKCSCRSFFCGRDIVTVDTIFRMDLSGLKYNPEKENIKYSAMVAKHNELLFFLSGDFCQTVFSDNYTFPCRKTRHSIHQSGFWISI
jgi:hypothetical protein